MKKFQILTAAAGILLALAGSSLAAQRAYRGVDAYASGDVSADRSGAYNYGPQTSGAQVLTPAQHQFGRAAYAGQNLPYPDRPYGDPDRW